MKRQIQPIQWVRVASKGSLGEAPILVRRPKRTTEVRDGLRREARWVGLLKASFLASAVTLRHVVVELKRAIVAEVRFTGGAMRVRPPRRTFKGGSVIT